MTKLSKRGDLFVELFGWFEDTDHIFIAMEYCRLGDLEQYVRDAIPEAQIKSITAQLLEGLNNEMRTQSRTTKDKKGEAFERFDTTQQLGFIHKILDRN